MAGMCFNSFEAKTPMLPLHRTANLVGKRPGLRREVSRMAEYVVYPQVQLTEVVEGILPPQVVFLVLVLESTEALILNILRDSAYIVALFASEREANVVLQFFHILFPLSIHMRMDANQCSSGHPGGGPLRICL